MKNIIICATEYQTGTSGAFHFAQHILSINDLSSKYRISLLTEDFIEKSEQRNKKIDSFVCKVPFKCSPLLFPFFLFLRNWAYYKAIIHFQKKNKVEGVLFNQAFLGVLSKLLLPKSIKVAGIIHDSYSLERNRSSYFSYKSYLLNKFTQQPLEYLSNHLLDFTIANSNYIFKLILRKRRVERERLLMIYQSIDIKNIIFNIKYLKYSELYKIKILFIKSGFVRGGLQDLIEAIKLLPYQIELTIVGPSQKFQNIFESWASGFSNISIDCIGNKKSEEITELMYSHHILCIPARQEALGLANIEGLAHGISVVSTKIGGSVEVLDNGRCGWLAEAENPISLASTLKECIESDIAIRNAKSIYGRSHVERLFSKEIMLEKCLNLFDKMTE